MKNDFNGNGTSDIPVSSPWGLGIHQYSNNKLAPLVMAPNGTRFGGWLLNTSDNNFGPNGDFDGDGKTEMLASSPWGIGVLKSSGNTLNSIVMAPNGTRFGGWLLNTADNQINQAGDFDGDGRDEILVTSPWGIGIWELSGNTFNALMLAPNGTRFGGWLLNTADNWFSVAGDFDGDGKTEILASSPWGIGVLKVSGNSLTSIVMAPNGTALGNWTLDSATNQFGPVGDFDGDGKMEVIVTGPDKFAILKLSGNSFNAIVVAQNGKRMGDWLLDVAVNRFGPVGDFDGDGRTEILASSPWGIGILKLTGNSLSSPVMAANGTRFGGWLLNTADNRFNRVADFDGDGKTEVLITSPWGTGILKQTGNTFAAPLMAPNGTRFGGWLLNTADNDWELGLGQSHAVIVYHDQWGSAAPNTRDLLRNRGYYVRYTDDAGTGLTMLRNLGNHLKGGDRLFVYLAGHGSDPRAVGDMSQSTSLQHFVQFNHGEIWVHQVSPVFKLLGHRGVDLMVFDGSCNGGEIVYNAAGERYCAMATTSVRTPGLTNTPDPSQIMKQFGKPGRFGLWWTQASWAASLLSGAIIQAVSPWRFHQRLYRNDNSEMNKLSVFYRTAVDSLKILDMGGWNLHYQYCYLFKHIYPDVYKTLPQAEKDMMTNSTKTYVDSMNGYMDPQRPVLEQLKQFLTNAALVNQGAAIYAAHYPKPWQTLAGDMGWNPLAEPFKYFDPLRKLLPSNYTGKSGFTRMVQELLNSILFMESCYKKQEDLLWKIDAAVWRSKLTTVGSLKFQSPRVFGLTDYVQFNEFERKMVSSRDVISKRVNLDRGALFKLMAVKPTNLVKFTKRSAIKLINNNVNALKVELLKFPGVSKPLKDLVAEFKAISIEHSAHLERASFLLTIVEDALSCAQTTSASTGDIVYY